MADKQATYICKREKVFDNFIALYKSCFRATFKENTKSRAVIAVQVDKKQESSVIKSSNNYKDDYPLGFIIHTLPQRFEGELMLECQRGGYTSLMLEGTFVNLSIQS